MKSFARRISKSRVVLLILMAFFLSSCTAPTRNDADEFTLVQEGLISSKYTQEFAACLMDGYDKAHYSFVMIGVRQQRRPQLTRIESVASGTLLMSADIYDDGRIRVYESSAAALNDLSGEKKAFMKCMKQYGIQKP